MRIESPRFAEAWIDPNANLRRYDKILPGQAEFEFRDVGGVDDDSHPISNEDRQRLIDEVTTVFAEELRNSRHFTFAEEAGPDVLLLVGGLHDIVSKVPGDTGGDDEIHLEELGGATLVLEIRDSVSGKILYRAEDRRSIERPGGEAVRSTPATTWSEVRRWARRWAVRLRDGLDSIHDS